MESNTLSLYCLGGPQLSTEWQSLMGDKYRTHLDFEPVLVCSPENAQVIIWDGVITPKSSTILLELFEKLSEKTVFLITGEAQTFLADHPFVRFSSLMARAVHLPPSRVLPEELLDALSECRKRLVNV